MNKESFNNQPQKSKFKILQNLNKIIGYYLLLPAILSVFKFIWYIVFNFTDLSDNTMIWFSTSSFNSHSVLYIGFVSIVGAYLVTLKKQ